MKRPVYELPVGARILWGGICRVIVMVSVCAGCGEKNVAPDSGASMMSLDDAKMPAQPGQDSDDDSTSQTPTQTGELIDTDRAVLLDTGLAPEEEIIRGARALDRKQWEERLRRARFRQVKPVSSRSRSLRLIFRDGQSAIFKPLLKGDSSGRLEVAFYRLATLLDVGTVPVSVMTPVYPDRFEQALAAQGEEVATQFLEAVERDDKGRVWGAMIQWLEGLEAIGAEDARGRLNVAQVFSEAAYRPLQRQLSDTVLLDYLLGNWDRFSGGNLFRFSDRPELALIDHNEAFYRLNRRQQKKLDDSLNAVPCISASLAKKIRDLTAEKLKSALDETNWQGELLRPGEIRNILIRKGTIQAFIDRRVYEAKGSDSWVCR